MRLNSRMLGIIDVVFSIPISYLAVFVMMELDVLIRVHCCPLEFLHDIVSIEP
jgi:hypothetical protein